MRPLKIFLLLSWQDKTAFCRAWLTLAAARLGIRFLGLSRTLALLSPLDVGRHPYAADSSTQNVGKGLPTYIPPSNQFVGRHYRATLWLPIATRYLPGETKCLPRSIALLALLRRGGIECELRIGIGKTDPALEAHAWVEINGVPVNETSDVAQRYSAFEPNIATS